MNEKIIIVTHKDYQMPNARIYMPICVGTGLKTLSRKFQPDNDGEHISEKNSTYCELTAIYWAWKNLDADKIGVAHYRRHFTIFKRTNDIEKVLTGEQLEQLFLKYGEDVVFTTPARYYIESIQNHYIHSLKGYEKVHIRDIERLKSAIHEIDSTYDETAKNILNGKSAHMLNMFIMSKENFNDYCEWLFKVIDLVVDMSFDRKDQSRYAGALSEFCLDIWAKKNTKKIVEVALLETEKPTFINRLMSYIKRKIK